jgi:hypothetical protein
LLNLFRVRGCAFQYTNQFFGIFKELILGLSFAFGYPIFAKFAHINAFFHHFCNIIARSLVWISLNFHLPHTQVKNYPSGIDHGLD